MSFSLNLEGRPDEEALKAASNVAAGLLRIEGMGDQDASLVRTIAADSTYRTVMDGRQVKTFTFFPETARRLPHVYQKLVDLGYIAVRPTR